jgi:hypothetical protein
LLRYQAGAILAAHGDTIRARELLTSALELNPLFEIDGAADARAILDGLDGLDG